jgi:hypothetical protein
MNCEGLDTQYKTGFSVRRIPAVRANTTVDIAARIGKGAIFGSGGRTEELLMECGGEVTVRVGVGHMA